MPQEKNLCLSAHDELYMIDLNQVLYFQADDHYTEVFYQTGSHFLIPFGLVKIEAQLELMRDARQNLCRLGRKYIVNTRRIFRINTAKELLYLVGNDSNPIALHVTKPVLRSLMNHFRQQQQGTAKEVFL